MSEPKDIFVVGAGGLGHEVAWTIRRLGLNFLGFADDDETREGVIGTPEAVAAKYPKAAAAIAIGDNRVRARVQGRLGAREYPVLVDPAAIVSPDARLGEGTFVGPLALVSTNAVVGRFDVVNARSGVGHDCTLGDFVSVSPGVSLSGFTKLGDFAFMGTNSCTLPGVWVGVDAKVAAGVPAYGDVTEGATLSPFGIFRNMSEHNKEQ